jgi:arsenate reductase-like glutaredoxin family protein
LRNELALELDERDYAKQPLSEGELKDLFKAVDPREYINPKSPALKAMNLKGKTLTPEQAIKLMAQEPNLIKRPLTIAGRKIIAGFDRDELRKTFG